LECFASNARSECCSSFLFCPPFTLWINLFGAADLDLIEDLVLDPSEQSEKSYFSAKHVCLYYKIAGCFRAASRLASVRPPRTPLPIPARHCENGPCKQKKSCVLYHNQFCWRVVECPACLRRSSVPKTIRHSSNLTVSLQVRLFALLVQAAVCVFVVCITPTN